MSDTDIDHTVAKLNMEAYTDKQLVGFAQKYSIQKEICRLIAYIYFQSHKKWNQTKTKIYNNDFDFKDKGTEQRKAYCEKIIRNKLNTFN